MFIPIRLARTKGLFNELVNPGVDVGFGLGLDLGLGPAQPYRDGVRCHTKFVSHWLAARKTFIRLVRPGRSLCATSNFDPHAAGQQVVREAAFEGVEFGELRFLGF